MTGKARRAAPVSGDQPEIYRLADNPMHYFASIQRQNQANLARALMPLAITPHVWRVLAHLSDREGRMMNDIADAVVIDRSNLSRLIDAMTADGLVERIGSERDRRLSLTRITDAGRATFAAALPVVREVNRRLMTDIRPEEFEAFMAILRRLKRNASGW